MGTFLTSPKTLYPDTVTVGARTSTFNIWILGRHNSIHNRHLRRIFKPQASINLDGYLTCPFSIKLWLDAVTYSHKTHKMTLGLRLGWRWFCNYESCWFYYRQVAKSLIGVMFLLPSCWHLLHLPWGQPFSCVTGFHCSKGSISEPV